MSEFWHAYLNLSLGGKWCVFLFMALYPALSNIIAGLVQATISGAYEGWTGHAPRSRWAARLMGYRQ